MNRHDLGHNGVVERPPAPEREVEVTAGSLGERVADFVVRHEAGSNLYPADYPELADLAAGLDELRRNAGTGAFDEAIASDETSGHFVSALDGMVAVVLASEKPGNRQLSRLLAEYHIPGTAELERAYHEHLPLYDMDPETRAAFPRYKTEREWRKAVGVPKGEAEVGEFLEEVTREYAVRAAHALADASGGLTITGYNRLIERGEMADRARDAAILIAGMDDRAVARVPRDTLELVARQYPGIASGLWDRRAIGIELLRAGAARAAQAPTGTAIARQQGTAERWLRPSASRQPNTAPQPRLEPGPSRRPDTTNGSRTRPQPSGPPARPEQSRPSEQRRKGGGGWRHRASELLHGRKAAAVVGVVAVAAAATGTAVAMTTSPNNAAAAAPRASSSAMPNSHSHSLGVRYSDISVGPNASSVPWYALGGGGTGGISTSGQHQHSQNGSNPMPVNASETVWQNFSNAGVRASQIMPDIHAAEAKAEAAGVQFKIYNLGTNDEVDAVVVNGELSFGTSALMKAIGPYISLNNV